MAKTYEEYDQEWAAYVECVRKQLEEAFAQAGQTTPRTIGDIYHPDLLASDEPHRVPAVDKSGATCKRCKEHNEYAAPSAAYVCYRCRV
jgi:hypothetical protein